MRAFVKIEVLTDSGFDLDTPDQLREALHEALHREFPASSTFRIMSVVDVDRMVEDACCGCGTDDK